jgi:high-affinity Fe2+/Pb2+ permease
MIMEKNTSKKEGSLLGHVVIMALFIAVGFWVGGFFGAFVGGLFAYTTWWLKEIHDMLWEKKQTSEKKE